MPRTPNPDSYRQRKRTTDLQMRDEAATLWHSAITAGRKLSDSIPPIPTNDAPAPVATTTNEAGPLQVREYAASHPQCPAVAYPHTRAAYDAAGRFFGVVVAETPAGGAWPAYLHHVRVWDHTGAPWRGVLNTRTGLVHVRRRCTAAKCRPVWFGPKHLRPATHQQG